jgi:hypothetical protein
VLLAHLRAGSLRVKVGDQVACGQPLAECGNAGNTSEPHVHVQVQDAPDYSDEVKTFPIAFRHVVRGGASRARRSRSGATIALPAARVAAGRDSGTCAPITAACTVCNERTGGSSRSRGLRSRDLSPGIA